MSQQDPEPETTGAPSRYVRSGGGLVGAMVVTVVLVALVVVLRGCLSSDLEVTPEPVDYLEQVAQLQDADIEVVYPPALPEGWIATTADVEPGTPPGIALNLLTDQQRFVGVRQSTEKDIDDLLEELVDERTDEEDDYAAEAAVADTWQVFTDDGGDRAYAAQLDEATVVMVYGSADAEELERVVESLTLDPLPDS